jgi:hypothetical protein
MTRAQLCALTSDHVAALRAANVTPHVAQNNSTTKTGKQRKSAIDGRTTRHAGYGTNLAAWTANPCATGLFATMPRALRGVRSHLARPKPQLSPEQEAAAELVSKGPDLATDGVVRWRRLDLACA